MSAAVSPVRLGKDWKLHVHARVLLYFVRQGPRRLPCPNTEYSHTPRGIAAALVGEEVSGSVLYPMFGTFNRIDSEAEYQLAVLLVPLIPRTLIRYVQLYDLTSDLQYFTQVEQHRIVAILKEHLHGSR